MLLVAPKISQRVLATAVNATVDYILLKLVSQCRLFQAWPFNDPSGSKSFVVILR